MKNWIVCLKLVLLICLFSACDDATMDSINKNPNAPEEVTISLLLPQVTISTIHGVAGNGSGEYASLFVEHAANVHVNERQPFDVNSGIWNRIYSTLKDASIIIEQGSDGGSQEGHYAEVGIAKILYTYTLSVGTDLFGSMPHSDALKGSENRTPSFDDQEDIYTFMQLYLDEAIDDLNSGTVGNLANFDLIFSGDIEMWKKTAYALKARLYNRLSNLDPAGSANNALSALTQAFATEDEGFVFDGYLAGSTNDNPWTEWQKAENGYAVSETIIEVINSFNEPGYVDPRADLWFTRINGEIIGAPPGIAESDVSHTTYSAPSNETVLYDEAPQPMITYDEMKFIEAEAHLRLGNSSEANEAYEEAVRAAVNRAGISVEETEIYVSQGEVYPGEAELDLEDIILQKYISFWMFQSLEAYNDIRRTGVLELKDPRGLPLRLAYPPSEINRNPNTPSNINDITIYEVPVWWARS